MKAKTISGHYGCTFSLAHNNRDFIPNNVDPNRIQWNYNVVVAGGPVFTDSRVPLSVSDYWSRYRALSEIYFSDRAVAYTLSLEKYREQLRLIRQFNNSQLALCDTFLGSMLYLLLLPLELGINIYLQTECLNAMDEWELFKANQRLRDHRFDVQRSSFRDALRNYDLSNGTQYLGFIDESVKQIASIAQDHANMATVVTRPESPVRRFASAEDIFGKLYEPSFRAFQSRQRPCRRFEGTYLEYILENQQKEAVKKFLSKNERNRKVTGAFELVIGIGDMDNTGYLKAPSDALKSERLLKDYSDYLVTHCKNVCFITTKELDDPNWRPPFRNGLIILNLNVHCDEATPGIHLTCIPYSRDCKRGPNVQASLSRAMAGMGYPSSWKYVLDENGKRIPKKSKTGETLLNKDGSIRYQQEPDGKGILDWIEEQKQWLQRQMLQRYGWEREVKGSHPRGNLSTPDYKVARAEERKQEILRQTTAILSDFEVRVDDLTQRLDSSVDRVWNANTDWEIISKYLQVCSDEEYSALIKKARDSLDCLANNEQTKVHQSLDNMINNAKSISKEQIPLEDRSGFER